MRKESKMNPMELVEREQLRTDLPDFRVGDTVRIHVKIIEGEKERVQLFEGVVIRRKRGGIRSTFTVRKISYGIGVERIFPTHSPRIDRIDILSRGKVRRGKLFYLRGLKGKAARIRGEKKARSLDCLIANCKLVSAKFRLIFNINILQFTFSFCIDHWSLIRCSSETFPSSLWTISKGCTIGVGIKGSLGWMRWEEGLWPDPW